MMSDTTQIRWSPHATVATIVELDGRFLMIEEFINGNELVINQPAGHVERDETLFEAARRETLEETGWKVTLQSLLGLYVYRVPHRDLTFQRVTFIAKADHHIPDMTLDDGIVRAVWMTRDEVAANTDRLRSHLVLECIDDYIAGKTFPLSFIHDQID